MWETNTRHHQQLPVQAAVEGPAACFRLMEVDDNGSDDDPKNRASMRHGHFIRLLMSATDNRMTLEDIQEVWRQQTQGQDGFKEVENIPRQESRLSSSMITRETHTLRVAAPVSMTLPSFLEAFEHLARAKYFNSPHGGEASYSSSRLLLADVYENVVAPTSDADRYGVCQHLLREDVSGYLHSQRDFTTELFASYFNGGRLSFASGEGPKDDEARHPVYPSTASVSANQNWTVAVSRNGWMQWADFLAMASDLQLVPRIVSVDDLKQAVEHVFAAPHRKLPGREQVQPVQYHPSSPRDTDNRPADTGMSYPQFVEALSLLAGSAAERLRFLYPDEAGRSPHGLNTRDSSAAGSAAAVVMLDEDSHVGVHSGGRRSDSPAHERECSEHAQNSGDGGRVNRKSNVESRGTGQEEMAKTRPTVGDKGRRIGGDSAPFADSETSAQKIFKTRTYDLGALRALYQHARIALEEKHLTSRSFSLSNGFHPAGQKSNGFGAEPSLIAVCKPDVYEKNCRDGDGSDGSEALEGKSENVGGIETRARQEGSYFARSNRREDDMACKEDQRFGTRVMTMPSLDLAHIREQVDSRLLELEVRIIETAVEGDMEESDSGEMPSWALPTVSLASLRGKETGPVSAAFAAGGAFSRLVVIKELQPVPEHAPPDARHLLELTLDHHQAGRFALALETLEKALTVWGSTLGAEKKRSLRARYPEEQHVGDIRAVGRIESSTEEGPLLNAGEEGMYHNLQNMGGARSRRTRGGLHAADEVMTSLITASIQQTAGNDGEALAELLKAEAAIGTIETGEDITREALRASVLGEIGVTLYYCGETGSSLRCFRLALAIRHELLQNSQNGVPKTDTREVGVDHDEEEHFSPREYSHHDVSVAEVEEAAAAISLNNVGVCLAGMMHTRCAVQALVAASKISSLVLGVEHPRSAVVARNLALVKTAARCARREGPDNNDHVANGRSIRMWEKSIWNSLSSRSWCALQSSGKDSMKYKRGMTGSSQIITGGFYFGGVIPEKGGDGRGRSNRRRTKGVTGRKKRGKSARR